MTYHFETFRDHNGQKMYKFRCSATCPYPECVIISNMPPMQGQGGEGEGDGNTQSNSQSGVHSNAGGSNSTSIQNQEANQGTGEGSAQNQPGANQLDKNDDGHSGGNGQERSDDKRDNSEPSKDSSPEDVRKERYSEKDSRKPGQSRSGTTPDSSGGDSQDKSPESGGNSREESKESEQSKQPESQNGGGSEVQPENEKSGTSPGGGSSEGGSGSNEGADGLSGEGKPGEQSKQPEQSGQADDFQEETPRPRRPEKREVEYKPVYQGEALSDGYFTGGGGVGLDDTVIANLGKHQKREKILTDAVFQTKLRNVMKDNAFDRYVKGRKRGRLDMRGLYKVPAKAENVFMLKEARKNKHYNVILVVDQSGSMYDGRKINMAAECAAFLARSLGRADIKYAVIGFSGDWRYHKKFTENATDDFLKKMKYDILHTGGGGTNLYSPLQGAYQELRKTPTHQNIVINLTDGTPASADLCRKYVRGNRHVAEFIDIGINSSPIMRNGIRINNVQELKPLLLRELKKRIKRG